MQLQEHFYVLYVFTLQGNGRVATPSCWLVPILYEMTEKDKPAAIGSYQKAFCVKIKHF